MDGDKLKTIRDLVGLQMKTLGLLAENVDWLDKNSNHF